jgi:hypothetical protein
MSRIVSFGCSVAYGLELPDCLTINDPPSKMGYTDIIGKQLNLKVLNKADTGSSQRQIATTILNTNFDKNDLVIINWANPIRRGVWNGIHWEQLASWTEDKEWKRYHAKYHRTEDDVLDSLMNINLANMFLKDKCKRVINSIHKYSAEIINSNYKWNTVNIDLVFVDKNYHYRTLKGGHPDLESHNVFAERVLSLI